MVNGIIAVVIAYLLGAIPSAYIVTRYKTGKDIRKLGEGNVGANNVYEHVGKGPAVIVGVFDVAKGAGAVLIAQLIVDIGLIEATNWTGHHDVYWVLGAGLAAVIGHIWPVYLKFNGGNGIATTLGILAVLMPLELLIAVVVSFLILAFTRNPILSINISLLVSVPISAGLLRDPWQPYIVFTLVLIAILVVNFVPTARAAMVKAGSRGKFAAELLRIEEEKEAEKKKKRKK
jgi:glycerol-3-phosphate acyltransferase PlsY